MMMVTGRLLLLCALCVLWCGVCGGGCSEAALEAQLIESEDNKRKDENTTTDDVGEGGPTGQPAVTQPAAGSVPVSGIEAESALQPAAKASGTANATTEKEDKADNEELKEEEGEEEEEEEEEEVDEDDEEKKEVTEEEKKQEEKDDTSTTKRISAVGQEEPILSSRVEEASNKTKPQSTQTTGDKDPAADGAVTQEEKQNENKEVNPKETPVESTVTKTTTATTGDSDGSTAVSHTTSPLLLLLVVACAAAAAVVAA
ncbi:Mucin-associated surface protein (MASP) [Trypanosoma cruzi]|uniref:Mucin-associated surface protein (MASP), putative n=2 Tax=Trypanosoma cruzi TaxID=5693 RepID=Q4DZC8_TRYCC|nr:mucin-associated surface protein (MASP), putative [Trypanosoma cruzi]EAN97864.1 mucin-associated surface protein (MASP), putative [Trypanosoma cruzi]PWV04047.1 Mucin-associated surface protein (MASP) [Trypanosoma cruzi]RNC53892.1 mucin-associated surface protein (MASP) [Trypanosoma cruzi]|eukprot:XP_819715.1 mucin-associated surface protein (MASP) [Trypanosoma cruzi strain CL Brener]